MTATIRAARARVRRWHSPLYTYTVPISAMDFNGPAPVCRAAVGAFGAQRPTTMFPGMGERA